MTFAEKLCQLRQQAGMSQSDLARASGLSLGVIRDYEQTDKLPSLPSAFKLAEALGVNLDVFRETIATESPAEEPPARPRGRPRKGTGQSEEKPKRTRKKEREQ